LKKFGDRRIGIFMDGPKGKKACDWGREALKRECVKFFSLHDLSKMKSKIRSYFTESGKKFFFTDEKWFVNTYAKLDGNECRWDEKQGFKWVPYKYISKDSVEYNRYLGSYGPTLGFMFNPQGLGYKVEVTFPKEIKAYVELQCNNDESIFTHLPEIAGIEKYLWHLKPKVALDVGSGIGRASVFFSKYFDWKDTLFVLADGDSGLKQIFGMRDEAKEFYNSLEATDIFCRANGVAKYEPFNLEHGKWDELERKPDLVYSFLALGFHWPINSFLDEIYPQLAEHCLLIFGMRGKKGFAWVDQQIEKIDKEHYKVIEFFFTPEAKKGSFLVLEKR